MKKSWLLFILFINANCFGQFMQEIHFEKNDTLVYEKTTKPVKKRAFTTPLKEKYNGKDFQYTENPEEEKEESSPTHNAFLEGLLFFISNVFPFLLGIVIIFIILKTFLGSEIGFWNFKKTKNKVAEKLVYQEEDIHETDIDGLLQKAIQNKAYRLAIRYYYLSVLKTLSQQKLIDYHKDKTNSEYLFEIEQKETRTQFSYLSYVYSYVWYGEFPIDEVNFKLAEQKYQSFKNSLK
ncbi:hypothetical protein [uncultured Polaribacter sp.]|uniref:DUF4129 domain-containing protein n=1 Tax=uncultured Polaribacter sp. TaxID=174711 RepID=UPI00259BE6E1|nr:hypothetical protein [uncultured Polaribacter sp.]